MHQEYPHPTAALLSYSDPRKLRNPQNPHGWPDYVKELGLSLEDLPHLMRMLKDSVRYEANSEGPRVWANLHAWRAIGQLCAKDAVHDLLDLIDYEEDDDQDDWAMEEIPVVLAKMGPPIFPVLSEFINDMTKSCSSVSAVARSLVTLQEERPELREQCITSLSSRLTHFRENDPTLNGLLMSSLADLKAVESLDLIRMAFQENTVDLCIAGDVEDIEISLGIREKRDTPQRNHLAEKLGIQHLIDKWRKDVEHEDCHAGCNHEKKSPPLKDAVKIGRNDPCLCGSGKKYKKCCLQ